MAGFSAGKNIQNNINTTEAQTLSNKTLDGSTVIQDGATIQTPDIIDPDRLDVKKDTLSNLQTYASTASNGQLVYATDSKKMFQVLDGALAEVGGGAGGINYITNPDAEVNADGWSNYANTVAGELPDDFGGTVSGSWDNIVASAASPLRGSKSFLFGGINSGSGDLQGHGVYSSFTVDSADLAKKMTISFDYKLDDSALTNAVDGMLKVFIYDEDKSQLIRVNGEDIQLNANAGTHYAQFQTDAVSTNYRLVIHNALALNIGEDFNVRIDNVKVGPTSIVKGTIVTDFQPYNAQLLGQTTDPTLNATPNAQWRRVGDSMEIKLSVQQTSAGTPGSGIYIWSLPDGYNIDFNKVDSGGATSQGNIGSFSFRVGSINGDGVVLAHDFGTKEGISMYADYTTVGNSYFSNGFLSTANATWRVSFTASVPIVGWSSNAKTSEDLGGREVHVSSYLNSSTNSTSLTWQKVPIDTVTVDTVAGFNTGSSQYIIPETGIYTISGGSGFSDIATGKYVASSIYKNSNLYKAGPIQLTAGTGAVRTSVNITELFEKGDVIELYSFQNDTTSEPYITTSDSTYLSITKLASPQTILETETVAMRAGSNSGQNAISATDIVFEDLEFDTHNAYNTSTGVYTVPVGGMYQVNGQVGPTSSVAMAISISVNGLDNQQSYKVTADVGTVEVNGIVKVNKGDTISIKNTSGGNRLITTDSRRNKLSIARIK